MVTFRNAGRNRNTAWKGLIQMLEADQRTLQNSTVIIMVPEDTTDEQPQPERSRQRIYNCKANQQAGDSQLSDDPMPILMGIVGEESSI